MYTTLTQKMEIIIRETKENFEKSVFYGINSDSEMNYNINYNLDERTGEIIINNSKTDFNLNEFNYEVCVNKYYITKWDRNIDNAPQLFFDIILDLIEQEIKDMQQEAYYGT